MNISWDFFQWLKLRNSNAGAVGWIPTHITSYTHTHTHTHTHTEILRSDQISRSVMSDSLQPHESQHARPPCASPTSRVHSDTSIESVMPSSHLILCCPLLLPPIPPSIRVFSNESTLRMRWPKYWSFSFSIIPSKEIPGLKYYSVIKKRMKFCHLQQCGWTWKVFSSVQSLSHVRLFATP